MGDARGPGSLPGAFFMRQIKHLLRWRPKTPEATTGGHEWQSSDPLNGDLPAVNLQALEWRSRHLVLEWP